MSPGLLVTTPDFPPAVGGIQHLLGEVVRRLTDWRVTVLTRDEGGATDPALGSHVDIVRVRAATRASQMAALNARAVTLARARSIDLVLCGHTITGPGAALAARRAQAPLVTYVYADEVAHRSRLARISLARSVRVIAISRYAAQLAMTVGARPHAVRLVPPGAGPVAAVAPAAPTGPSIVTVARLSDRYKGHDLVLEALPAVRATVPAVVWHVVGDGPLRAELETKAHELGVADAVVFHGQVDDDCRDALVAGASVFAMPSRLPPSGAGGEGFGIVYLEAALLGVPSVAGNSAGVPDAVVDGETGLLVDPGSFEAIAEALIRLLRDDELRKRLGDRARERAERDFSWDRISTLVDEVLREALEGR